MNLKELLKSLTIKDWKFWIEEGELNYNAPEDHSNLEILNQLKRHKSQIVWLLQECPEIFQIDSAIALNEEQVKHFKEKGWVGPFDTFSSLEINTVLDCLESNVAVPEIDGKRNMAFYNNVYNIYTPRDQHLFHKPLAELVKSPKIVQRLNQLGEPDLLLWRTNVFAKMAGLGEISWHQVFEKFSTSNRTEKESLVYGKEDSDTLNLTVWVALDDATRDNGCLQFANGTHHKRFGFTNNSVPANKGVFAGLNNHRSIAQRGELYSGTFDFNEDEWEIEAVPAKAGQIIIFTERCMHSSLPNKTDFRRLGVNARYIRPSVHIYPHRWHGDFIDENGHNIEKQFSILVSGQDKSQVNVVRDWNELSEVEVEFQKMFNLVNFRHVEISKVLADEIQGLYQQALNGDCQNAEPKQGSSNHRRWQAWKENSGMTRVEAMEKYSQLVASLPRKVVGDWQKFV